MLKLRLIFILLFITQAGIAQKQFPPPTFNCDSILDLSGKNISDEEKITLLSKIDSAMDHFSNEYPLYRGMLYMYQAFYCPAGSSRYNYQQKAIDLISNNKKFLPDSFSYQCYQLLDFYSWKKRMNEWMPIDKLLRDAVTTNQSEDTSCILLYADKKMNEGHYTISNNLASYDLLFSKKNYPNTIDHQLARAYDEWISVNSRYKEWLSYNYYSRNEKFTLKQAFRDAISHLGFLKDSAVKFNAYGSDNFQPYKRKLYYGLYKNLVLAYANWSISDHREGQAIVPLKVFLLFDLIPNEVDAAVKANSTPVISCSEITELFIKLTQLYINISNGNDAADAASKGIRFLNNQKHCNDTDVLKGISYLSYLKIKADRIAGNYTSSLKRNELLKQWYPLPVKNNAASIENWNWYIEVRLQEIYTLIAQHKNTAAGDSLRLLMDNIAPIENDTVQLLYKSYQWPQLQFASMQYLAELGKWDVVRQYTLEALTILEQENHWENVSYYYDLQLLYFIANYRSTGKILKHVVANLLFYTGRHLQNTFFMLSPEDRIRLYEQKLSAYFDVYHELLLSKLLDDEPSLKEKIISQSLFLKNALVDANLLSNEFLAGSDSSKLKLIDLVRANINSTNILAARFKMLGNYDNDDLITGAKNLWLQFIEDANIDSLSRFTGWEKIASALKPEQVYVEAVRYTKWLSDSSSVYAAYVIKKDSLNVISLFDEKQMQKLLSDPAASPQSGVLSGNNSRGLTLTKKDSTSKKFKPGSEDKLATLVLSSLWHHINNKKELLIVPDGLLNRISLAALEWKGKPLFSYILLKQLSGSYVLQQTNDQFPANGKALLAGGLNYGELKSTNTTHRLLNKKYSWQYLPATKKEVESLDAIFKASGQQTNILTAQGFPDTVISVLSNYDFIHVASHGFYADTVTAKTFFSEYWNEEAIQNDPMLRCGIAVSDANNPTIKSITSEGHLMGFELANTDLRKCYLISLSACETGLGDLRNNLGVDGLSRALKLGGAKYLLISLWKVPDAPTAVFMQHFYKELFKVKDPSVALKSTQQFMSKQYNVPDWAAFVLVE